MSIVPLDKITIYGTSNQKADVLDGLQELGCLHLIALRDVRDGGRELVSKEAREAYRYLQSCRPSRRKASSKTPYDREQLIRQAIENKQEAERLVAARDHLQKAIEDIRVWGEFDLGDVEDRVGKPLWFYEIPPHELDVLSDEWVWFIAGRDNRFAYVVLIADEPADEIPQSPVELDRRPLSELKKLLDEAEERLDELHWERVGLTRWRRRLKDDLDAADDAAARAAAAEGAFDDQTVFAIQGYVPRVARDAVVQFADQRNLAVTIEPIAEDELAPTLLHNPKQVAGAENCVTFYITPGYHSWDPTSVVFFSFSLFFAMIVADAGYGLVMAIGLCFGWRRLGRDPTTRRMRSLFTGIVLATITYGILVGSYFGVEPGAGTWLDRLRIRIDGKPMMQQQTAMMVIAVSIGVAHLVMANLISAWHRRRGLRWIGHLGWAMLMIGGFLLGGGVLADLSSMAVAGEMMASSGAVAILLFSSDQAWSWSFGGLAKRLLDGVLQFTNLSKAFGDVLSYLRLFALGLASAQLAVTFNALASETAKKGGIGLLAAILILVVGHSINFMLGILGGVVHGLRLNCIEFFNWSLNEEGYAFEPFQRKAES